MDYEYLIKPDTDVKAISIGDIRITRGQSHQSEEPVEALDNAVYPKGPLLRYYKGAADNAPARQDDIVRWSYDGSGEPDGFVKPDGTVTLLSSLGGGGGGGSSGSNFVF